MRATTASEDLALACSVGDMPSALDALARGGLLDAAVLGGKSALDVCLSGPHPATAIALQLAVELASGKAPWRGRDGHSAATRLAMLGDGELMEQVALRLPLSLFERDAEGLNAFDFFCERCCSSGAEGPSVDAAVSLIAPLCDDAALASAIGSCLSGLEIARELGRGAPRRSDTLDLLEAHRLRRDLLRDTAGSGKSGSGSRRL